MKSKKKERVNYRICHEIKEKIISQKKFKNFSHYIREAVIDFIRNPLTVDEIHVINEKLIEMENEMDTSTVLLYDEDIININEIKRRDETYNFDTVYLLAIILYHYANKKKLI